VLIKEDFVMIQALVKRGESRTQITDAPQVHRVPDSRARSAGRSSRCCASWCRASSGTRLGVSLASRSRVACQASSPTCGMSEGSVRRQWPTTATISVRSTPTCAN